MPNSSYVCKWFSNISKADGINLRIKQHEDESKKLSRLQIGAFKGTTVNHVTRKV